MTVQGSCHCGKTRFEIEHAPTDVTFCTCSYCSKRGALWGYYSPQQFRLLSAPEDVATYQWNTGLIKHHFCASCGCSTFCESPDFTTGAPDFDNPRVSINARLLDNFDLEAVPKQVIDGKNLW